MPLRLIIVGPGRAGMSVALAARRAGHVVVGVLGRSDVTDKAAALDTEELEWGIDLPTADLLVIAVRDDAIRPVSEALAPFAGAVPSVIHLSGLKSVDALLAFDTAGLNVGGFHPLQTMPNPEAGSRALSGAAVGITAGPPLQGVLEELAVSIGARPFSLDDGQRPLYHAGAACAANYVLAALGTAEQIFNAADVPFSAARPLVTEIIANAFELGPTAALTGPIARGDVGTVAAQVEAVESVDPDLAESFKALGRVTARLAGAADSMSEVLE